MQREIPHLAGNAFIGGKKHLLAHKDALLIDDRDENVAEFRHAGGKAILIPRPWNNQRCHTDANGNFNVDDFMIQVSK